MGEITLHYFTIRGKGEAVRLLLEVTGTPYKEALPKWPDHKPNCVFGQLPEIIDGDIALYQSMAIYRHIARRTNTYGKNIKETAIIDMIIEGESEWRNEYTNINYSEGGFKDYYNDIKEYLSKYVPGRLTIFEKILASNNGGHGWFVGNEMSAADPIMYEMLDIHHTLSPSCLDGFALLKAFRERFEVLPKVIDYIKHKRHTKINGNDKGGPLKH